MITKSTLVAVAGLAVLCVALDAWRTSRATLAGLTALQQQYGELVVQAAERERLLGELSAAVQRLSLPPASGGSPSSGRVVGSEIDPRLNEVLANQSNILARLDRLGAPNPPEEFEQAAQRRRESIAALEGSLPEQERELATAKQQTTELLDRLQVPDEVSGMMAHQALDVASLRAYWPYFEAKRKRDRLQEFVDKLRLHLEAERIEAQADAARRGGR